MATRESQIAQPCKVIVHAIKGYGLKKQDSQVIDSYLTLQLKEEPESIKQTRTIGNDLNPIWNSKFEMHSRDWKTDSLVINMYNRAAPNGEKMMNELDLPIKQWPIGTHIDYQEDVYLNKKKAGRIFLGIDILNETHQPAKQRAVNLTPMPRKETESYSRPITMTETSTEPLTMEESTELSVRSRGINLDEPTCEYCDFTWGDYDSRYSTDFTGFTENSESLSALRSTEARFHRHHKIQRSAVLEPLQPIVPEQESTQNHDSLHDDSHNHSCAHDESSCQHCNFNWGDYDSRYSTDFTGFTENSQSLSALNSTEQNFHHNHKTRDNQNNQNSILAPEKISSEKIEQEPTHNHDSVHDDSHNHSCAHDESSCQHCNFNWGDYDSRYSTDFTGFTENSQSLSAINSTEQNFHHNHKTKDDQNIQNSILAPETQSLSALRSTEENLRINNLSQQDIN